jgi:hypothetical protein
MSSYLNRAEWRWLGKSRRHALAFEHNTVTGAQRLFLDGTEVFKSGWMFRLTGAIHIPVDDASAMLQIGTDEWGALRYVLTVDSAVVAPVPAPGDTGAGAGASASAGAGSPAAARASATATVWTLTLGGERTVVEYDHRTLEILVNGVRTEAEGAFGDEDEGAAGGTSVGARHSFLVPPRMEDTVVISIGSKGVPSLTVNGAAVAPDGR